MATKCSVTPYLACGEAARAIELYKKAFGAKEILRVLPTSSTAIAPAARKAMKEMGASRIALTSACVPLTLNGLRAYLGKLVTMAAVVATLAWVPAGAVLAVLLLLFGSSLHAFITFGGAINGVLGVAAWWSAGFILALVYAVWLLPYERGEA